MSRAISTLENPPTRTQVKKQKAKCGKTSFLVRRFTASLLISAVLTQASYAQDNLPMSERQKAEIARKKADEKSNDEAYQAMIKRTGDVNRKADPWGILRTPPANGNK